MPPINRLLTTALVVTLMFLGATSHAAQKPNVIFILADDLGWSDTTLYGTTGFYKTPNIERLAKRGVTFSRAYSASPLCSPTRASILTGLSPARHGITAPVCHLPKVVLEATPGLRAAPPAKSVAVNSVTRLRTDYMTFPKVMRREGYATGHFGKWHLGPEPYSPLEHGFRVDIPHHPGPGPAGSYVAPWRFRDFDHDPDMPKQHLEDRMAQEAVDWMGLQVNGARRRPFLLNYWMFSVHAPFDAKEELIQKYRPKVDRKVPQQSPTYAAMIESMDDAIGTLLDAIDRLGIADETIIIFASDNGGNMYNEVDGVPPTSNAPLRGGKATMYEGGVRGPAIVVWPGVAKAGSRSDEMIQSCDFYPTLLEMLDLKAEPDQTFDGVSIAPALKGQPLERNAIFTYFPHSPPVPEWLPPSVSVHQGDWKLIRLFHMQKPGVHGYRLFNLKDDIGEQNNLADKHPDLVAKLDALITAHLKETDAVLPIANPAHVPSLWRPDLIGVPARERSPASNGTKPKSTVAGWVSGKDCTLVLEPTSLRITSSGNDPMMTFELRSALPAGTYSIEVDYTSDANGEGQFFFEETGKKPKFIKDRSVILKMVHDGNPHKVSGKFTTTAKVPAIRFDPAKGKGVIRIRSLVIRDESGKTVRLWRFGKTSTKQE